MILPFKPLALATLFIPILACIPSKKTSEAETKNWIDGRSYAVFSKMGDGAIEKHKELSNQKVSDNLDAIDIMEERLAKDPNNQAARDNIDAAVENIRDAARHQREIESIEFHGKQGSLKEAQQKVSKLNDNRFGQYAWVEVLDRKGNTVRKGGANASGLYGLTAHGENSVLMCPQEDLAGCLQDLDAATGKQPLTIINLDDL